MPTWFKGTTNDSSRIRAKRCRADGTTHRWPPDHGKNCESNSANSPAESHPVRTDVTAGPAILSMKTTTHDWSDTTPNSRRDFSRWSGSAASVTFLACETSDHWRRFRGPPASFCGLTETPATEAVNF